MGNETLLIIFLCGLVVILALLLSSRIYREKKESASIKGMNLKQFSGFLSANSIDGNIQEVARKVSDLLKSTFGCKVIVFLRKKRNLLELNYFHGLHGFNRRDFSFIYSRYLFDELKKDFFPRPIAFLNEFLPERFRIKLNDSDIDLYFPIYWRSNLYGIYFIKSNIETRSPAFNLLIASLAQSLSAAYHIKWHESKQTAMQKQLDKYRNDPDKTNKNGQRKENNILKLVKHHSTETLIPKIMETLKSDLKIKKVAYFYESRDDNNSLVLFRDGGVGFVKAPDISVFNKLLKVIDKKTTPVNILAEKNDSLKDLVLQLKSSGFDYISSFPLSSRRAGVLAWSSSQKADITCNQLDDFKTQSVELMDNAESYEIIEEMSFTDNLTGLANQRYFQNRLIEEVNRAKRYSRRLALIFFDFDQLKNINDNYGHLAGDAILKQMGDILRNSIRSIDIIARYGGDEFCIIMPEADSETCLRFMERLKSEVARARFLISSSGDTIQCTVSLGGAVYPEHAQDPEKLIHNADMALLKAKEMGRNMSMLHS